MNNLLVKYKWKLLGIFVGSLAGFAYWYYIGCNSGTCPIQSNWHTSTLYGALIGFVLPNSTKKNSVENNQRNSEEN